MLSPVVERTLPADPDATVRFGRWLGQHLRPGDVLALVGGLGAGKTTLVRGVALGLGVDDPDAVCSPTYLLVVEHPGRVRLVHADAYLPDKLRAFLADGGLDYLLDAAAVTVVEWADLVRNHLPESTLWLEIEVARDGGRQLRLRPAVAGRFSWIDAAPKMDAGA
ncbi:MAG: tRNA (adenosine(37)-N6)-threonylcarbamoyltransferase complex ATPase subunit type 1 TsaE [Planctomycetes bacterium]|nr:tRNA (adenosine(37)-N6)-threonylcarbamoyltransferase complex ATPase subunit type 1 TsaE [Planctomycetota bacterium]